MYQDPYYHGIRPFRVGNYLNMPDVSGPPRMRQQRGMSHGRMVRGRGGMRPMYGYDPMSRAAQDILDITKVAAFATIGAGMIGVAGSLLKK